MVRLGEVSPTIAEQTVERIEFALGHDDFEDEYEDLSWRKSANKRKFDRELFQKYGYMKDIILHPKFQHIKHYLEENADFNVFLGDPMLPTTTAIIILFMLNKRISNNLLGLSALLIFNVNPFYVVLAAIIFWLITPNFSGKKTPRQYRKISKDSKSSSIKSATSDSTTTYDHVLIGSDISTLYTAALLAKNGHRCCVLQPATLGQLFEIHPVGAPCPAPIMNAHVERIERYQALLDAAQSINNDNNRVTFVPTGTETNGYTSAVIHTTSSNNNSTTVASAMGLKKKSMSVLSYLRVGENSLSFDLCTAFPLEKSMLTTGLQRLYSALPFLTSFLVSHTVPLAQWNATSQSASEGNKLFKHLSTASVAEVVRTMSLDTSPAAVAALEGMAVVGAGEALCAADCSGYVLASTLYGASQGAFYPIGGAAAVAQSLTHTILQAGGSVYPNVQLKEVLLEESTASSTYMAKATGVRVSLSVLDDTIQNISESNNTHNSSSNNTSMEDNTEVTFMGEKSIVSGIGAIATFTKLIPGEAVSAGTAQMLAGLRETRPRVRVIYWLRGAIQDLCGLNNTDYYEIGTQPYITTLNTENRNNEEVNSKDTTTAAAVSFKEQEAQNELKRSAFARESVHVWSPSCKDPSWSTRNGADLHVVIVELELTQPFIESKEVSFSSTSATGSSTTNSSSNSTEGKGPTIYYSLHADDFISDPEHPDYDTALGIQVSTSKSKKDQLQQRADRVLDKLYTGILNYAEFTYVQMPVLSGGAGIANTTEKFARPLSAVTDIQNLYLTGRDLGTTGLAGDLQGGWVAANAVLGYQLSELIASRNIVSDLANMKQ